jgi:hypothetical protein
MSGVDPRLGDHIQRLRVAGHVIHGTESSTQGAGLIAAHVELRVDHQVDACPDRGADSAADTESTRNGISSVTISTAVWPLLQPFSLDRGCVHSHNEFARGRGEPRPGGG